MQEYPIKKPPESHSAEQPVKLMIGKVASLYDISVQTLRHYDKIGLFRPEVVSEETGSSCGSWDSHCRRSRESWTGSRRTATGPMP